MARPDAEGPGRPEGRLLSAARLLLGAVMIAIVLVNVGNAAARYLLGLVLTGADEIMVFSMVFIVIAGAVLALVRRSHIALGLLPSRLTGRVRLGLFILHDLVTLAAAGFATHASWLFVNRIAQVDPRSMSLGIPMTIPHAFLLAGLAALAAVALAHLGRDLWAFLRAGPQGR